MPTQTNRVQLYDVWRTERPVENQPPSPVRFVMRAPLDTITIFLRLRVEACERIKQEATTEHPCLIHNVHHELPWIVYGVIIPRVPLNPTRRAD